ncbi:hypothetical protein C8J55DRAFT_504549 [Lentinula edodes]|uniref:Uncharacterized protein n=1 Tax=Lentinula lateritia TaxID=40482 RepID=A0A9W9DZF2_9AGAR|nr:hypothetical protein C8J55DRAFT_504549 [Lentinula edodes]
MSTSNELEEVDRIIAMLTYQRAQLTQTSDLQKTLLSPIRKLPPGIMSEIFRFANWEVDPYQR